MTSDSLTRILAPRGFSVLSILRIFTGLDLLQHGTGKILGFPSFHVRQRPDQLAGRDGWADRTDRRHPVHDRSVYAAGRFPSFRFHCGRLLHRALGKAFYPILNGGELAALFSFVFLYFAVVGGGAWSADALIKRA